ncbi:hypothetical protein C8J36_102675 [Rhizobium sp. PP-F2F-G48]|uniref:hypothetical protein n=1 Tax=Rhizobium sp. PP-F2F-G48 TaxID=2135651 RepID=UPI0010460BC7|nr:hypothetical protein [Rhizobium sp. PP-F2F-G48]TCM57871.1 hypothetical protein C8J36_102675 [Rhizobium sp. PP-F2F-G48]
MPFKAKTGLGAHDDANQAPSWDDICNMIDPTFSRDLRSISEQLTQDAPVRRFLKDLFHNPNPNSNEVVEIYNAGSWTAFSPQLAAMKVAAVIDEYILVNYKMFRADWPRRTQRAIASMFILLGELPSKRYPSFDHGLLPVRAGSNSRSPKSLGALDWPELAGIRPSLRDEEALELVRSNIIEILEESEAVFSYGQSVLRAASPPKHVNDECWMLVKRYLHETIARLRAGEDLRDGAVDGLNLSSTWIYAGFPKRYAPEPFLEPYAVRELASRCIGATNRLTASVKLHLCTVTGWNRTQIGLVPFDPYAFRYEDACGICEAGFMTVFKRRAGHFVNAHLERGAAVKTISRDENFSLWDDAVQELEGSSEACIVNSPSAMEVLDRYVTMTEPLREFDLESRFNDRFFVSIGQGGLSGTDLNIREYKLSELLGRRGVSYRTTRQTFVNVIRRSTGSLAASIHLTNNSATGVLLTHYDDPEIQAELDAAIAFWQNCFQALVIEGDTSLRSPLKISDDDLEWFSNLAIASGIASSIQVRGRKLTIHERDYLEIERSSEAFQEIYLVRRGILAARQRVGERRWRVQGVPILGYVVAMRRHLLDAGLIDQYFDAVRTSLKRLQKREIVVPTVMDD